MRWTRTILVALALAALLTPLAAPAQAAITGGAKIDLLFALDTTGSMSDEIALVRRLVWDLANGLISGVPGTDRPSIRLGLVRYRDTRDTYVVKVTPLTFDLDAVHKQLMHTRANGGGDTPEHVNLGLHKALDQKWRDGAERLVFLIGDARPSSTATTSTTRRPAARASSASGSTPSAAAGSAPRGSRSSRPSPGSAAAPTPTCRAAPAAAAPPATAACAT